MKASSPEQKQESEDRTPVLPDFCALRSVFAVVMVAQLLVFVVMLADTSGRGDGWGRLGMTSLLVQWVALSCTAVLCLARPWLLRLDDDRAAVGAYVLLLLIATLVAELAWQISRYSLPGASILALGHGGFLLRCVGISAIVGALVLRYQYVHHRHEMQRQAQSGMRLQALQARIRPHFLFNSMNTIASLTRSDPRRAEEVVQDLADLFRVALSGREQTTTVADELALARRYLQIERHRLGDRLRVLWHTDDLPGAAALPALVLQPLLENAVCHGVEPSPDGGEVEISGSVQDQTATILVRNSVPREPLSVRPEGNRMAIDNIRQRLIASFGERGKLLISRVDDSYQVRVVFPVNRAQ